MVSVDGSNTTGGSVIGGCLSICDNSSQVINASSCNGINCCQTTIPSALVAFSTTIAPINKDPISDFQACKSAFLGEEKWFQKRSFDMNILESEVPVALEWRLPYTSFSSLPTTNNTANCIINHPSILTGTQLLHVLAKKALKGIHILMEDVKVKFLYLALHVLRKK
jgi:hypothetical protein